MQEPLGPSQEEYMLYSIFIKEQYPARQYSRLFIHHSTDNRFQDAGGWIEDEEFPMDARIIRDFEEKNTRNYPLTRSFQIPNAYDLLDITKLSEPKLDMDSIPEQESYAVLAFSRVGFYRRVFNRADFGLFSITEGLSWQTTLVFVLMVGREGKWELRNTHQVSALF